MVSRELTRGPGDAVVRANVLVRVPAANGSVRTVTGAALCGQTGAQPRWPGRPHSFPGGQTAASTIRHGLASLRREAHGLEPVPVTSAGKLRLTSSGSRASPAGCAAPEAAHVRGQGTEEGPVRHRREGSYRRAASAAEPHLRVRDAGDEAAPCPRLARPGRDGRSGARVGPVVDFGVHRRCPNAASTRLTFSVAARTYLSPGVARGRCGLQRGSSSYSLALKNPS